jgi:2-methylcitrate dehydratase PrpD
MNVTEELAKFVVEFEMESAPDRVVELCKQHLVDAVAITLAGSTQPVADTVVGYIQQFGELPLATIIGRGLKASPTSAAFANGVMAHCLDWDDESVWHVHTNSIVSSAVLSVSEWLGLSGRDALEAFIVGSEVCLRMGRGTTPDLFYRRLQATGIVGGVACAAGCAKLFGFNVDQTRTVFNLALVQSAGTLAQKGTDAKSFQSGNVARAGVMAASLVKRGFTANPNILDDERGLGYFPDIFMNGSTYYADDIIDGLGEKYEILGDWMIKAYPVGTYSMPTIDAALEIRRNHEFKIEEIEEIEVITPQYKVTRYVRPKNRLEAAFGPIYSAAVALIDKEVGPAQFTDERFNKPDVQNLMQKAKFSPSMKAEPRPDRTELVATQMSVKLCDGRKFTARFDKVLGSARAYGYYPLTWKHIEDKYAKCARLVLSDTDMKRVIEMLKRLEDGKLKVSELLDILRAEKGTR